MDATRPLVPAQTMVIASVTSTVSSLLEHHGALAVFLILAVDAVLPVGGEVPMLLSGAVAAGVLGHGTTVLGLHVGAGLPAYLVLAVAGTLGYLSGSLAGWAVGRRGGRELIERHGRWLHLGPERLARADRWFDRYGRWAILLGRITPLVRSFISVASGVVRAPLGPYIAWSAVGAALWCFGLAGAGWALGSHWENVHSVVRAIEVAIVLALVGAGAWLALRGRRAARAGGMTP